jgi:hypothetical protein
MVNQVVSHRVAESSRAAGLFASVVVVLLTSAADRPAVAAHPDQAANPLVSADTSLDSLGARTTITIGTRTVWVTSPTTPVPTGATASIGIVMEDMPSPPSFALEINDERVPARPYTPAVADAYQRFVMVFTVKSPPDKAFHLLLLGAGANVIARVPLPRFGATPWSDDPKGLRLPVLGQSGAPVEVAGPFDGDATTTTITIDGRRVNILAESPTRCWFYSPPDLRGAHELRVKDGASELAGSYRALSVVLSAPKTSLQKGERVVVTIEVGGLEGLREDAPLFLRKGGVVSMEDGDAQSLKIRPGDVANGSFVIRRTLTGLAVGDFSVHALVLDPRNRPRVVPLEADRKVNGFRAKRSGAGFDVQVDNVEDPLTGDPVSGDVRVETRCGLDALPVLGSLFMNKGSGKMRSECLQVFITPRLLLSEK